MINLTLNKMKKTLFITLLIVLSTNLPITGNTSPAGIELAIILNKDNPTEKLNPAEVKDYWLRRGAKKKWKTSSALVMPLDRKAKCPEKELFYSKVLTLGFEDVEAYFAAKQYQSAEAPPEKLATDKDVIDYVSSHPGAIGFVNKNSLVGDLGTAVKTVCVIAQ
jgi:ABC-type phosphate transport system substrate-binding protein